MNKAKDLLFKLCRRLKCNALFAALFTALLLLPDRLFEIANPRLDYSFDPAFVFALAVFGFCLSLCGRTVGLTVLAAFGLMQFIQLSHIAYFGRPINPVDVAKIYDEFSDVREAGIGAWRDVWFVAPLVLLTFGYLARFLVKHRKILGFSWFAVIAVVIALGVKPERAARKSLKHFLPAASRYSVHNSLNTFSFFLVKGHNIEPTQSIMPEKFYVPYVARPTNAATPDVIVFVMGESTNTAQMSLFGAQAQTTPFLDSLKSDKRFLYKKAIAGAVSTHSSLPVFFNLLNEPANMEQLAAQTSNLFKLAKQAGYKTYWLSAQDAKNTNDIGTAHIDELITKEENPVAFAAGQEDYLLQLFKETDTAQGKHFIVLHFRTMHDPFEKNYEHHPEFDAFKPATHKRADRTRAAYRNAMLYTDDVLRRLFDIYKEKTAGKSAILAFTSDHGQLLGEDGLYGHNKMLLSVADVPFFAYADAPALRDLRLKDVVFHYEIGTWLARVLGYEIINPNKQKDVFFIHGNNFYQETDYMAVKRTANGVQPAFYGTLRKFLELSCPAKTAVCAYKAVF